MSTKQMSWDEMVLEYPDMWIAVKDAVMDGPDILSGEVFAIKSDEEIIDYEDLHSEEGLIFRRTKGGRSNGPIRANFVIETSE